MTKMINKPKGKMGFWGIFTPKCPNCGAYTPNMVCDLCNPPKVHQEPHLNLLAAMDHVKAWTGIDVKELVWDWLIKQWFWTHNDSCFGYSFPIEKTSNQTDKEMQAYMYLIKKVFHLDDFIYFDVSW